MADFVNKVAADQIAVHLGRPVKTENLTFTLEEREEEQQKKYKLRIEFDITPEEIDQSTRTGDIKNVGFFAVLPVKVAERSQLLTPDLKFFEEAGINFNMSFKVPSALLGKKDSAS